MLPDLDSLHCFTAAARLLSFRAAARAVNLTPAALGQRIKSLEEQLDVRLFHRTTRSVALTEEGMRLLPFAQQTLAAGTAFIRAGQGQVGPAPMELVIGTRHELGMSWVVPMLDVLQKRHPQLTTHLYFGSGDDLLLRVRTLEIDAAITSSRLTDPKLDAIRLHREDYVFVGAPRLLQKKPLRRPEQARDHVLLDVADTMALFRYWRDAPGGIDSMAFAAVRRLGTIAAIRALALRGAGVAVLPLYFVRDDLKKKRLRRLLPKIEALHDSFRLVFRSDDPRRSTLEAVAATLAEQPLR